MVEFVNEVWLVLLELAPWLLLGSLVAGVMHVLLPSDFLSNQLRGSFGLLKAVAVGVPLPLCSCAVIPVGLSLKQSGASRGATVAFLISTPQTGVDSVLVSASFLGWPFALFKVASATVMGIVGGWWTDLKPEPASLPIVTNSPTRSASEINRWQALWLHSLELLRSIWRWLVFGVLVSAAISTWMPTDLVTQFAGGHELASMLVTLVIALPLYVCATASVPIAAALASAGLPVGAALVFLMAGPATNVATVGAVYRTLGIRALAIYLATVVLGSMLCGWMFSYLLESASASSPHVHNSYSWISIVSAVVLLVLLARFAGEELMRRFSASSELTSHHEHGHESCCE